MLFNANKHVNELKVTHLNKVQAHKQKQLAAAMGGHAAKKSNLKKLLKEQFNKAKSRGKSDKKVFVLDFDGDIKASAVAHLREEISTLISMAKKHDEVVVRLESPGGMVHGYGLAAAQLARLKEAGLKLTVCVDKVAASGGYMMACVADQIVSAPFAVVGSIGVVAQMPNFHKLLEKHDVDFNVFTAGEYKRTVTVFGENDAKGVEKFKAELEQTHVLFKQFVETYRPKLDLAKVATGEHWFGQDALNLKLVDKLQTSDSYLLALMQDYDVYALHSRKKPTLAEKLGFATVAEHTLAAVVESLPDKLLATEFASKMLVVKKS